MKKIGFKVIGAIIALLIAGIYYYVTIPAVNIHSSDFWFFLMMLVVAVAVYYILKKRLGLAEIKESKAVKAIGTVLILIIAVYAIGSLLSSPIINAKKYQQLLQVDEGKFTTDVQELSYDQIPLLDKD